MKPLYLTALLALTSSTSFAYAPALGPAPAGDTQTVAETVIKDNWPNCKRVVSAKRRKDGAIQARCDKTDYLVFTMFDPREGRHIEMALNCSASARLMNLKC